MKRLVFLAAVFPNVFLALTTMTSFAQASGQEIRACDFDLKGGCRSGQVRVTLADGKVVGLDAFVIWCGRGGHRKSLDYSCTINSARGDGESTWSDDAGATVINDGSPYTDPTKPDRIKVTVGRDVSIDLDEAQSLWRCGAGAELPLTIVIPAQGRTCRVRLRAP
jgi:hypothetical protein